MNKAFKRRLIDRACSLLVMSMVICLAWFFRCPAPPLIVQFVFCFLFVVGVYFFFRTQVNKSAYEQNKDGIKFKASGPVALFCFILVLFLTFGYSQLSKNYCGQAHFQVVVKSIEANHDRISKGKVLLFGLPRVDSAIIDQMGEAHFEYQPEGERITFKLKDAGQWYPVNIDSVYEIENNKKIELLVELRNVDSLRGIVTDENRIPLEKVRVRTNIIQTFSEKDGSYLIVIPRHLWSEKYTLSFSKDRYEPTTEDVFPPTDNSEPFTILKEIKK